MQAATGLAAVDRSPAESHPDELPARNDSVLCGGELGDRAVTWAV
jgi:hypothetical protein